MHQAHPEQNDPVEPEGGRPSIAEVVQRLDHLWSEETPELSDFSGDHVGQRVGKYILQRIVGRGSFGVVYQAYDPELDREVALKLPRPEVLIDAERLNRFEGEATTAARLDHPAIVPIFDAEFTGPVPYIASAYCSGPDLGDWLAARKTPVEPQQAAEFVAQLAEAVHYAHQQGVLHRDLKPSNIMLEPHDTLSPSAELADYEPRLTDFGLAKLIEASLHDTRSSLLVGTPLYMAPEQIVGDSGQVSAATDVHALGVMLFELLSLELPYDGNSYFKVFDSIQTEQPRKLGECRASLPRELETICGKCLEKDPRDRYPAAAELAKDLSRFVAGEPIAASSPNILQLFLRWCRHPNRLSNAVTFSIGLNVLYALWMIGAVLGLWLLPDSTSLNLPQRWNVTIQALLVICVHDGLMIALSWWSRRGNFAFLSCATIYASFFFLLPLLSVLGVIPMFADQYEGNAYFEWSNSMLILVGGALQLFLYGCAWWGVWRKQSTGSIANLN
ncbi:serine/threonine-protein kinase [Bythopirellula goksoeyrii]|uniref:Serine/threonine-protein kinase PknB n=1 Tax=Bythopirellula goksoeyrii TaxID=1400387 RepID=A0A5B9Q9F2_9BACT|nr:serine/threonine-protein kinase [Bythopirellula goksoeyrii]QEG33576.1 Serine/threonine-protein kinase PknB [Bythopirellula goksoeyrii]